MSAPITTEYRGIRIVTRPIPEAPGYYSQADERFPSIGTVSALTCEDAINTMEGVIDEEYPGSGDLSLKNCITDYFDTVFGSIAAYRRWRGGVWDHHFEDMHPQADYWVRR